MDIREAVPRAHQEVLAAFVPVAGKDVVDVGCGAGALVRWLRSQGANVVGVECGDLMIAHAREADTAHAADYLEGAAQDLPLPDESADVVVFSYSLHHVPTSDMVRALREAHRVLRQSGTLYVVEPVAAGPGHEVVKVVDDETAVRAHAQEALRHAPDLGFEVVDECTYVSRTVVASAEALAERVVGVDPARGDRMRRHRAEFTARFEALATRVDGGFAFDQENLVKVYRRL